MRWWTRRYARRRRAEWWWRVQSAENHLYLIKSPLQMGPPPIMPDDEESAEAALRRAEAKYDLWHSRVKRDG
jgi:hypothetical protein